MVRRIVVAACVVAIAACAAKSSKPTQSFDTPPGAQRNDTGPMPGDPRAELDQRFGELESQRAQLQLAEPTPEGIRSAPATPMAVAPHRQNPSCKPAATERCTTSCTLSDSICSNAKRICELAQQIGDTDASQKCARANTTCSASQEKCCGCR